MALNCDQTDLRGYRFSSSATLNSFSFAFRSALHTLRPPGSSDVNIDNLYQESDLQRLQTQLSDTWEHVTSEATQQRIYASSV